MVLCVAGNSKYHTEFYYDELILCLSISVSVAHCSGVARGVAQGAMATLEL